jgi:hypothetical protein
MIRLVPDFASSINTSRESAKLNNLVTPLDNIPDQRQGIMPARIVCARRCSPSR